jgi:hypothetical protein
MDKKKYERWKREKARQEEKAREEASVRVARVKVLEEHLRRKKGAAAWLKGLAEGGEPGRTLVELLTLYREETEYRGKDYVSMGLMRKFCREELEALKMKSEAAFGDELFKTVAIDDLFLARPRYDLKRQLTFKIGLIERFFGYATENELRDPHSCCLLDDIFRGGKVKTFHLQELFGMDRKRFPKGWSVNRTSRETSYGFETVIFVMDALLRERPVVGRNKRKPRQLWLERPGDPDLRRRVLGGIKFRVFQVKILGGVSDDIVEAFWNLVRKHWR